MLKNLRSGRKGRSVGRHKAQLRREGGTSAKSDQSHESPFASLSDSERAWRIEAGERRLAELNGRVDLSGPPIADATTEELERRLAMLDDDLTLYDAVFPGECERDFQIDQDLIEAQIRLVEALAENPDLALEPMTVDEELAAIRAVLRRRSDASQTFDP